MKPLRFAIACLVLVTLGFGSLTADEKKKGTEKEKKPELKKVVKTDAEWKRLLTPIQYEVTRKKGTERRGTGETWNLYKPGTYSCVCCGLLLFKSETKFKSGTGWPSFYDAAAKGHVATKEDRKFGWSRTEMLCRRCDAHIGHVFDDGPKPTGLRYCANSAALKFTPADEKKKKPSKEKTKEAKKKEAKKE